MRTIFVTILIALAIGSLQASEIREFDLKTIESLGRQLYEHRNQNSKSLSEVENGALEATKASLKGRIDKTYKFIVLHDPTKSGYLVYALATSKDPNDIVLGIHYRVTVSADASRVERVDPLSRSALVLNHRDSQLPKGYHPVGFYAIHLVSRTPVETHVCATLLHSTKLVIMTMDRTSWAIENGKISKM